MKVLPCKSGWYGRYRDWWGAVRATGVYATKEGAEERVRREVDKIHFARAVPNKFNTLWWPACEERFKPWSRQ